MWVDSAPNGVFLSNFRTADMDTSGVAGPAAAAPRSRKMRGNVKMKIPLTIDPVTQHDTNCNHDLEHARDAATDLLGRALGDERRRDGRDGTNAHTGNDTSAVDVANAARAASDGLQDLRLRR